MRWLNRFFGRRSLDRRLDAELRFHLDEQVKDNLAAGMSPSEARRQARLAFGGLEQITDACRDVRRSRLLGEVRQDVRYACRTLLQRRGFTAVVVLTLALGIGSTTLTFSVANAMLLRPLPFDDPDRLVWMWAKSSATGGASVSPGDFLDYRDRNRSFVELASTFYSTQGVNLAGGPRPERVQAAMVSANLFTVLQVSPLVGRDFRPEDERVAVPAAAVLTHGLWQRRFGGRHDVIGKTVRLDDKPATIVGVMPAGFRFPHDPDLWFPTPLGLPEMQSRTGRFLNLVGRLRDDVTLTQAQQEMDGIAAQLEAEHPDANTGFSLQLVPLRSALLGGTGLFVPRFVVRRVMLLLLAAVGLLLLIACANVANVILARGTTRRREFATRAALGASRLRLVRLLIAEHMVLALVGGLVGTLLAIWGVRVVKTLDVAGVSRLSELSIDPRVLLFALLLSLATAVIFGTFPAFQMARLSATEALRASSGTAGTGQTHAISKALVVVELAMSLTLLVAAGLTARSFAQLLAVDPGFNPSQARTLPLTGSRWEEPTIRKAFFIELLARVERIPGIVAAGVVSELPLTEQANDVYFHIDGSPPASPSDRVTVDYRRISPGYFRAMEIPVLRGRTFTASELSTSARVALVDERLVERFVDGRDPLGQRLVAGDAADTFEIIGVVGGVRHRALYGRPRQTMYVPDVETKPSMTLVVRTAGASEAVVGALRETVLALDETQPVSSVAALDEVVSAQLSRSRFSVLFLASFCAFGLVLAAVGLYGVLAFATARRTPEIAVRMALGSERRNVLRLVVGQGMRLALLGIALGIVGAYAASRVMENMLFGIAPHDQVTFVVAILLLATIAFLASYIPARRAAAIDPARALREE